MGSGLCVHLLVTIPPCTTQNAVAPSELLTLDVRIYVLSDLVLNEIRTPRKISTSHFDLRTIRIHSFDNYEDFKN